MIEYRCPSDGRLLFKAGGEIKIEIEIVCKTCKERGRNPVVNPVISGGPVFQSTCECTECGRRLVTDCPVDEMKWCMACGTRTLWTVEEIRGEPLEVPKETPKTAFKPARALR